jgi:hypothetical protein
LVKNLWFSSLLSKNVKITIYRTIILPFVLYGRETWLLTLREECRLRVFENRVLRRIFGPKRYEVTEEWRRQGALCCVLLNRCNSGDEIKKIELGRACATYGEAKRCRQGFSEET